MKVLKVHLQSGEQSLADLPTPSFAERQVAASEAVKTKFAAVMLGGYSHNFGGSAGWRTLDMRDADDKANWTLLLIKCQGLNAAGAGAHPITIRGQNDETFETTAATALAAMQSMLAWGEATFARKWALEAEIAAAADEAVLAAIDIDADWP